MIQDITKEALPLIDTSLKLHLSPIIRMEEESRRSAEIRTTQSVLYQLYGADAKLLHHTSGAPYLPQHIDRHISISHTEEWLAIGTDLLPLGIDIEQIGVQVLRVRARFVSSKEEQLLQTLPTSLALHLLWSAKEAAYKLLNPIDGSLLGFQLSEITIDSKVGQMILCHTSTNTSISVHLYWTDSFVLAIAR